MTAPNPPTPVLDYSSAPPVRTWRETWQRVMLPAAFFVSHACTAATLCVVTVLVDDTLRFPAGGGIVSLPVIESALGAYGVISALLAFSRGPDRGQTKVLIAAVVICLFTGVYIGMPMPRLNRSN